MKKVHSTTVIGQAEMLQVVLRKHGIESRLENEGGAMLGVGLPTAAVPIVIVVDDSQAEEAARIIAAEFQKPRASDPTAIQFQLRCACGKTLEYPKGEDPPDECPWCGRPTQFAQTTLDVPSSAPKSRSPKAVAVTLVLIVAAILFLGFRGKDRRPRGAMDAWEESQSGWTRKLRDRVGAIPAATVPPVDPEAIAAPLAKEFPEDAARFAAALAEATSVDALIDRWNRLSMELSPDWAAAHGFADGPRLSRYSRQADQKQILMNAAAMRRLRTLQSSPPSLDGRLFERYLEHILLSYAIFGPACGDPRPAYWGILTCAHILDRPELMAERLEQVPAVIGELRRDLTDVPRLWLGVALDESNAAMVLLREIERTAQSDRLKGAVGKAREALSEYGSHLRKLKENNRTTGPRDPRWTMFLVRDVEFSGRTPRDLALELLDEAAKTYSRWRESDGEHETKANFTAPEWRRELQRVMARARDLAVERKFADVPAGDLPELRPHPYWMEGAPEWPHYDAREYEPSFRPRLWEASWEGGDAKALSSARALCWVAGEVIPGRHLQKLVSRRDGTLIRRLYWSSTLPQGWREHCRRWMIDAAPECASERSVLEGWRFMNCWSGAVELCYLSGTVSEEEALEMLQSGLGESAERAQRLLADATLAPLHSFGGVVGDREIATLRTEQESALGASFDLRRFHERLLGFGRTPISLVREEMRRAAK